MPDVALLTDELAEVPPPLLELGQLATSALLPSADASAPAARRLDSLLLLAPTWALTVGIFIDRVG